MTDQVFAAVERNRRAFAELVGGLSEEQLAMPSLCDGWDCRTVAGHVAAASSPAMGEFLGAVLRSRGNAHRANTLLATRMARRPRAELLTLLRERASNRATPPVVGPYGPLTDAFVHGADIAFPLGLPFEPDPADVRISLGFVTGGRAIGFVRRGWLDGLRLVADDAGFVHGDGAEIRGRGLDVLVAVCGRPAALERVDGPGVAVLRSRIGG
ncbi:maleylpyruvate isomerase family mycothiol-dependent enzyme [Pseudonocardia endophytica]|uniref:Uncharacterized protein (TIGR03083 family) n=1 Tax=Pseudonocardia endophytica TaxID=401976 RepID=A0A4V2PHY2_PSEEN|nr:maleylpyruvate isomerase family mycothiol-dependent enzyme [Pseudonocardia endophytica]TCK22506.1 uncharacterized protein (TIGR03083 family) [Pseudonocardia endophytica]